MNRVKENKDRQQFVSLEKYLEELDELSAQLMAAMDRDDKAEAAVLYSQVRRINDLVQHALRDFNPADRASVPIQPTVKSIVNLVRSTVSKEFKLSQQYSEGFRQAADQLFSTLVAQIDHTIGIIEAHFATKTLAAYKSVAPVTVEYKRDRKLYPYPRNLEALVSYHNEKAAFVAEDMHDIDLTDASAIMPNSEIKQIAQIYWTLVTDRRLFEVVAAEVKTMEAPDNRQQPGLTYHRMLNVMNQHITDACAAYEEREFGMSERMRGFLFMTGAMSAEQLGFESDGESPSAEVPQEFSDPKGYFEILGITPVDLSDKTEAEIMKFLKQTYRPLALKYHPDKSTANSEKFRQVMEAYTTLSDRASRSSYLRGK